MFLLKKKNILVSKGTMYEFAIGEGILETLVSYETGFCLRADAVSGAEATCTVTQIKGLIKKSGFFFFEKLHVYIRNADWTPPTNST